MTPTIETRTDLPGSVQRMVRGHLSATLINGNSETMEHIAADALISDPPWGIGYKHSGKNLRPIPGRHTQPKRLGVVAIMGDDKQFDPRPWLRYKIVVLWGANHFADRLPTNASWLVWDKRDGTPEKSFSCAELAWCSTNNSVRLFRYLWQGICQAGEKGRRLHQNQKPVALMAWSMAKAKVPEGATVLDPYMGSGSTGIACLRTNRNFIGIEIDTRHFKVACDRFAHEVDGVLL